MRDRRLKSFFQRWAINTVAVLVACYVVNGVRYEDAVSLFVASLLLGILNTFLRPLLILLTLPIFLVTLGLFTLFINALLLYFTGYLLQPHFYVEDYWSAFKGALIISVVSLALNTLTGTGNSRVEVRHAGSGKKSQIGGKDDGNGPVIDV